MIRTALNVLAVATCAQVIAIAATIGIAGTASSGRGGDGVFLQFEPQGSRGSRGGTISVRAQGAAGEDVAFDPTNVLSPRSPMGACASATGPNNASGDCRDNRLLTGKNSGEKDFPLDLNGWESDSEEKIWSNAAPGQSNEELVISAFVPQSSDLVGELEAKELGSPPSEIGGGVDIGEIPEPSTMLLLGGGFFVLGSFRKRNS